MHRPQPHVLVTSALRVSSRCRAREAPDGSAIACPTIKRRRIDKPVWQPFSEPSARRARGPLCSPGGRVQGRRSFLVRRRGAVC